LPPWAERVPEDELASAIARAGADNPLLGFGTGAGNSAEKLGDSDTGGGEAARLIDAVGAWLGHPERRVAASLVVLGYSARLLGPTLAVLLRDGILLDARPAGVRYAYAPETGFVVSLSRLAGWRGEQVALREDWCRTVLDAHLRPVIDAVRAVVPVAAGLLWGNVASGLAGTLRSLAASGAVPLNDCYDTGEALLRYGPLRDSGTLSVRDGQLTFLRRSCCLYYRIEGAGTCGDCPL
jgi:ferric iron reductase protein FhuF